MAATKQLLHISDYAEDPAYKQHDPLAVRLVPLAPASRRGFSSLGTPPGGVKAREWSRTAGACGRCEGPRFYRKQGEPPALLAIQGLPVAALRYFLCWGRFTPRRRHLAE